MTRCHGCSARSQSPPAPGRTHFVLAAAYERLGRHKDAEAAIAAGMKPRPGSTRDNVSLPIANASPLYLERLRQTKALMASAGLPKHSDFSWLRPSVSAPRSRRNRAGYVAHATIFRGVRGLTSIDHGARLLLRRIKQGVAVDPRRVARGETPVLVVETAAATRDVIAAACICRILAQRRIVTDDGRRLRRAACNGDSCQCYPRDRNGRLFHNHKPSPELPAAEYPDLIR